MPEPAAPEPVLDPRRRTLILAAVCAALAAVIASMSGLNIAQQAIALDLGLPIKLVGLGEQVGDLVDFDPDAFVEALFEV